MEPSLLAPISMSTVSSSTSSALENPKKKKNYNTIYSTNKKKIKLQCPKIATCLPANNNNPIANKIKDFIF